MRSNRSAEQSESDRHYRQLVCTGFASGASPVSTDSCPPSHIFAEVAWSTLNYSSIIRGCAGLDATLQEKQSYPSEGNGFEAPIPSPTLYPRGRRAPPTLI